MLALGVDLLKVLVFDHFEAAGVVFDGVDGVSEVWEAGAVASVA